MQDTKTLTHEMGWVNIYSFFSLTEGKGLLVNNLSSSPIFVSFADTAQLAEEEEAILPLETNTVSYGYSNVWIKGAGPVTVSVLAEGTSTEFIATDLPRDVWTSSLDGYRRLRVDPGQASFFEGREFRSFFELNLPSQATRVFKIVVPVNTILYDVSLVLDAGAVKLSTKVGGTEGGSFSTTLPVIRKNTMIGSAGGPLPLYQAQNVTTTGGTHTGGTDIDIIRLVAANATAQQSSVGSKAFDQRGVGPGTYYWVVYNFSNSAATGVFSTFWSESPVI